jgi:hypothetical protein
LSEPDIHTSSGSLSATNRNSSVLCRNEVVRVSMVILGE